MKNRLQDLRIYCVHCLAISLVWLMAACAERQNYYWVKYGGTSEQIQKDNARCADMTTEKPSAYARGSAVYWAPLDQAAYQECMRSLGYRKMTEEELNQERFTAAIRPGAHHNVARELCQRVMGRKADLESCTRYMSMNVKTVLPPSQSQYRDSLESDENSVAEDMNACLRKDPIDASGFTMIVSRDCLTHHRQSE